MTVVTTDMLADMHARRLNGEPLTAIAAAYNINIMTAYQALRRKFGLANYPKTYAAANDNHPDRIVKYAARNGGYSGNSGLVPVTMPRIPTIDGKVGEAA